jgi:hypothetical protein
MSTISDFVVEYENDFEDCDDHSSSIVSVKDESINASELRHSIESGQYLYEVEAVTVVVTTAGNEQSENEYEQSQSDYESTSPTSLVDDPTQLTKSEYVTDTFDVATVSNEKTIDDIIQQDDPNDAVPSPTQNNESQALTNITLLPPEDPSRLSLSSYNLSSIPTWTASYIALHLLLSSTYTGTEEDIQIPETVIFFEDVPTDWFCTPVEAIGVFR